MKPLSIWTYVISLALWLSLCLGMAVIVIVLNFRDAEKDLMQYGDAYSDHLDKEMLSSETILKGFSALFGAVGNLDQAQASRYVRQVIEANPQIFALEIVQAVAKNQLAEFIAQKRRDGIPEFAVKSFTYDAGRKWQAPKEKPFYYPIVFMEPMPAGSADILGLDMESVPFLQRAMSESLRRRAPVASHPFRLVQGNLAYVVFFPAHQTFLRDGSSLASAPNTEFVVDMVIDAAKLAEPVQFPIFAGGVVLVHHQDFRPEDPRGQLLMTSGPTRGFIETAIFPSHVYKKALATSGESFFLVVKRQLGWSDLSLGLLVLIALLTILSSMMLIRYLREHQQGRILLIENQNRLWQLANHDSLTGIPNRMLLLDRLEQQLARMRRQGKHMAVLFLDLDEFKQVNDTYGHEVGDQLLRLVAERLCAAVREGDTVARMCGDEFIVLLEGVEDQAVPQAVSRKIQQKLSEGFLIASQLVRVRTSIGIAIFPEDGDRPEELIKQADTRMYADKQARTAKLRLV